MPMGMTLNPDVLSRHGLTQQKLGDLLGLSQPGVHRKLRGHREWTLSEINAVLAHLHESEPSLTFEQLVSSSPERKSA